MKNTYRLGELQSSKSGSRVPSPLTKLGHGKDPVPEKWNTTSTKGSSKRGQSVPVDISKRTNPEEKGLDWKTLDEVNTSYDYLFPDSSDHPCPVEKELPLKPEQQELYIHWICRSLSIDRNCKDPRIYCAYCDMNNHPRFACKHVEKHRNPQKEHRCTLCRGRHPPFLCPRAQINGGPRPAELVQARVQEG